MINKIFPRLFNSSKDNRLRKKTEMKDAYNITVGNDYGDFGNADDEGNQGVLKPAAGATAINLTDAYILNNIFLPDNDDPIRIYQRRVLGSVVDDRTDSIYIFVYSNFTPEIGVYVYDGSGYFGDANVWRPIYRTPEFQWNEFTRVVGDVVHVSGGEEEDFRPVLYFTDDENEPRRLDINRFIGEDTGYSPATAAPFYNPNDVNDKDLICACPRSPVHQPIVTGKPAPRS